MASIVSRSYVVLLEDDLPSDSEDVIAAESLRFEVGWNHSLNPASMLLARARIAWTVATLQAESRHGGYVGALVGYRFTHRQWLRLQLLGGFARVLDVNPEHLYAVEPYIESELAVDDRLNRYSLSGTWTIRQNVYIGGKPERAVAATARWHRRASDRPLRGTLSLGYEYARYTYQVRNGAGPDAEDEFDVLHTIRATVKGFYGISRRWRLFAESGLSYGMLRQRTPATVDSGTELFFFVGLGYIMLDRLHDEELLAEVW